jgi:hypothetical protein
MILGALPGLKCRHRFNDAEDDRLQGPSSQLSAIGFLHLCIGRGDE